MPVQVVRNTGPRDIRDIHSDIKTVRAHVFFKGRLRHTKNIEELSAFFRVKIRYFSDVPERDYHDVAVIIGVPVEDQRVMGAPEDDKVPFVFLAADQLAKKATAFLS
jgi:hypothetical protein